jgi:hypothetical protein
MPCSNVGLMAAATAATPSKQVQTVYQSPCAHIIQSFGIFVPCNRTDPTRAHQFQVAQVFNPIFQIPHAPVNEIIVQKFRAGLDIGQDAQAKGLKWKVTRRSGMIDGKFVRGNALWSPTELNGHFRLGKTTTGIVGTVAAVVQKRQNARFHCDRVRSLQKRYICIAW